LFTVAVESVNKAAEDYGSEVGIGRRSLDRLVV
jgi:hypothetical protein